MAKSKKSLLDYEFSWAVPHFFLRFNPRSVDIFCLNLHCFHRLETRFVSVLSSRENVIDILLDPFILYIYILGEWVRLSADVFWHLHERIAELEKSGTSSEKAEDLSEHYNDLHALSKHITQQLNEVAQHSLEIAMAVQEDHEVLLKEKRSRKGRSFGTRMPLYGDEEDEEQLQECQANTASRLKGLVLTMKLDLSSYETLKQRVANQINLVRTSLRPGICCLQCCFTLTPFVFE